MVTGDVKTARLPLPEGGRCRISLFKVSSRGCPQCTSAEPGNDQVRRNRACTTGQRRNGQCRCIGFGIPNRQHRTGLCHLHHSHTHDLGSTGGTACGGVYQFLTVQREKQLSGLRYTHLKEHLINTGFAQRKRIRAGTGDAVGAGRAVLREADIGAGSHRCCIVFRHQRIEVSIGQHSALRALRAFGAGFSGRALRAFGAGFTNRALGAFGAGFTDRALRANRAGFTDRALRANRASRTDRALGACGADFTDRALRANRAGLTNRALGAYGAGLTGGALRACGAGLTDRALRAYRAGFTDRALRACGAGLSGGALRAYGAGFTDRALGAYRAGLTSGALRAYRAAWACGAAFTGRALRACRAYHAFTPTGIAGTSPPLCISAALAGRIHLPLVWAGAWAAFPRTGASPRIKTAAAVPAIEIAVILHFYPTLADHSLAMGRTHRCRTSR